MDTEIRQQYGSDPLAVRKTDHYKREYVKSFAEKWDELIDWERRAEGEGDFFIQQLAERGANRVLDLSTGTGFHSVRLLQEGFDVVSADGSSEMLAVAFRNAKRHGFILRTVHTDWRMLSRDVDGQFDAAVCLGNSFTHLFDEKDRRKALAEYYSVLSHDGVLIIDQRNYDAILDDGYSCKHTYHYCGEEVTAEPEYVDDGLARFKYSFPDDSEYHLNMYPLRREYLRRLLEEAGFMKVTTFGDYQAAFKEDDIDFYTHVAEKWHGGNGNGNGRGNGS